MGRNFIYPTLPLAASFLIIACGNKTTPAEATDNAYNKARSASTAARQLELPEVPVSINDPEERTAYAVVHFWDALNPAEHTQSLDTAFMEQSFANFIGLLPYAPAKAQEQAVEAFAKKCGTDSAVYDLAATISQKYLNNPNSPTRNEELNIHFLRRYIKDGKLSESKLTKAVYRLEQAMKNRPGTQAADFRLITREGRTSTLLRELHDTTLIVFYDHDCGHCKETVERLADPSYGLHYPVVAVEITEDRTGWEGTNGYLPEGWTVAFATDAIDGEAYYFPALPSLYLLSGDGTVIVKDGTIP